MKQQISNSMYGLLDYAAYPIGMLIVAPFIIRDLGVTQYGLWAVMTSVVNIGSIVASGFGDATTQKIASSRSRGGSDTLTRVVRAAMGIHLVLGLAMSTVIWCVASGLANRLASHDAELRHSCILCIHIAAMLTAIRTIETVCISAQKGCQRYSAAVGISIAGRLLSLAAAMVLASRGHGIAAIMFATAVLTAAALGLQIISLQALLGTRNVAPTFESPISAALLRFGAFTWILAATGVVFGQADRLIGGASLGPAAIASYALCAQLSQPVYGLAAAGLHFLFPYIADRGAHLNGAAVAKPIVAAALANIVTVLTGAGLLLVLSPKVLHFMATDELAEASAALLPLVLAGSTLLALSVTGSYAMIGLGRARIVAVLNVGACVALVIFTAVCLRSLGVCAMAAGRIAFALIALGVYFPLYRELRRTSGPAAGFLPGEVVEGA